MWRDMGSSNGAVHFLCFFDCKYPGGIYVTVAVCILIWVQKTMMRIVTVAVCVSIWMQYVQTVLWLWQSVFRFESVFWFERVVIRGKLMDLVVWSSCLYSASWVLPWVVVHALDSEKKRKTDATNETCNACAHKLHLSKLMWFSRCTIFCSAI